MTASVDNMILKKTICIDKDLTIEGAVTWVGCSSLEIHLEVKQSRSGIFISFFFKKIYIYGWYNR